MAYEKTNWINGVTPTSAENLNKIEDELENLDLNKADKSTTYDKTSIDEALEQLRTGWNLLDAILTYSSWDSEVSTAVLNTNIDLTGTIELGDRLKFTQDGAIKYGIVTAKTSTQLTVFLGTDYTLTNTSIIDVYFSHMKTPFGFPIDEAKWTLLVSDTSTRQQGSPVGMTYYNLGNISLKVPVGFWKLGYKVFAQNGHSGTTSQNRVISTTLSTTPNGNTNPEFLVGSAIVGVYIRQTFEKSETKLFTSETTWYLNTMSDTSTGDTIYNLGGIKPTQIFAVCDYL